MTYPWLVEEFQQWLREDAPLGDYTTRLLGIAGDAEAVIIAETPVVMCCSGEIRYILGSLGIEAVVHHPDSALVERGAVASLRGPADTLLLVERTLLNLLRYIYGVAHTTRVAVERARRINPRVRVAATRKTPPGLRYWAKRAVECGGGDTHRYTLSDMILVKDNHKALAAKPLAEIIKVLRQKKSFAHKIEVEAETPAEALEAAEAGADIVMLDNMPPSEISETLLLLEKHGLRGKVLVEASGGITIDNIEEYAATGVDIISLSQLTMNPIKVDITMEIDHMK